MVPFPTLLHKVERRSPFAGTEPFLFSLLKRLEFDLAIATSSLHCLQLDSSLRTRVADTLVPITKMKVCMNENQNFGTHELQGYPLHHSCRQWARNYSRAAEKALYTSYGFVSR